MPMRLANDFLIGCDPEFVALDKTGHIINCGNYLSTEGEVGLDHSGWVIELRPEPSKGTYAVVRKLKRLLESGWTRYVPNINKLRAGAYVESSDTRRPRIALGGHIHFGFTPYTQAGTERVDYPPKIKALDAFSGYLEALDILPKAESTKRRASSGYGKYSDVRMSHGFGDTWDKYRVEYRTMGSWLTDPKVAMLALTGAKLAVIAPKETQAALKSAEASWKGLREWLERFKSKDQNAERVLAKIETLKSIQIDPTEDFRERWKGLGGL